MRFLKIPTSVIVLLAVLAFKNVEESDLKNQLTVVFYNTENLFDTTNNKGARDGEFTPEGKYNWTVTRYGKKLNDIARVLASVNKSELPEIIGLCEIENRNVVNNLIKTNALKNGGYKVVHFESPDYRGIDCALLYRPDEFTVTESRPVRVRFTDDPEYKTRDILYVKGKTLNSKTLHLFVNHWPSRAGGEKETEKKRIAAARILKSKTDSIFGTDSNAHIIIAGDLNDEPSDLSLNMVLGAKKPGDKNALLLNMMFPEHLAGKGSYNYRGKWNLLDNIVVSKSLNDGKGIDCIGGKGYIYSEKWMQTVNGSGTKIPFGTYSGSKYTGGISDHFPVYIRLSGSGR